MIASEEPSFLPADPLLDELPAMALKYTTSPENAPKSLTQSGTLWCAATQSFQDMVDGLQMFSEECSGPH